MTSAAIISIVYLFFASIFFYLGFYMLNRNAKDNLIRIFYAISIALTAWAFTFSVANSAPSLETALFWRRMAAFGWGSVFGMMLHFIMAVIHSEEEPVIRFPNYPLLVILIYVFSLFNIIIFGLYGPIADTLYALELTGQGWVNTGVSHPLNTYFNLYYTLTSILTIILTYYWGKRSKHSSSRRTSLLLISMFLIPFIIGSSIDVLIVNFTDIQTLQIAVMFTIFPAYGIYVTTTRYSFIVRRVIDAPATSNQLLSDKDRFNANLYLSILAYLSSILSFIYHYFIYGESLSYSLFYSIVLLATSVILYYIPRLNMKNDNKDLLSLIVLAIYVPYIVLTFAKVDSAITVWVLPAFIIMLSITFIHKYALLISGASATLTLLLVWLLPFKPDLVLANSDHILRLVFIIVFVWFASFIRNRYLKRLKEHQLQIEYQQLIATISSEVLTVSRVNLMAKLKEILELIGNFTNYDHVFILAYEKDRFINKDQPQWYRPTIPDSKRVSSYVSYDDFLYLKSSFINEDVVYIDNSSSLPDIGKSEQLMLKDFHSKSCLVIPITAENDLIGIICLNNIIKTFQLEYDDQKRFRAIGNLLTDAYLKSQSQKDIHNLAYYDVLTQLPNRALLQKELETELKLTSIHEKNLALMFIDLDSFKMVNDTVGHAGGDYLLKMVAARIKEAIDPSSQVFRFSGDEFIILCKDIADSTDAIRQAEQIIASLKNKFIVENNDFSITCSIGIAMYPEDGTDPSVLIKNADYSMYEAKQDGKNKYKLCTTSFKEKIEHNKTIVTHLQRAIDRNEFYLMYQPQVNTHTGKIVGYEALLRWECQELGPIPPSEFIPIAEKSGLIRPIGHWVLHQVCKQYQEWGNQGVAKLPVAINISSQQFRSRELINDIKLTLAETHMRPELLEIEITESVAIKDYDKTIIILNELKALGLTIAIDDFGTEYSSLNRLKELPVNRVKIAMNFVHGINLEPKDEAVINVIIYLSEKLGLKVIAEGVETTEQLEYLKKENCLDIQGFYFYKPMLPHNLAQLF